MASFKSSIDKASAGGGGGSLFDAAFEAELEAARAAHIAAQNAYAAGVEREKAALAEKWKVSPTSKDKSSQNLLLLLDQIEQHMGVLEAVPEEMNTPENVQEVTVISFSDFLSKRNDLWRAKDAALNAYEALQAREQVAQQQSKEARLAKVCVLVPDYSACEIQANNANENIARLASLLEHVVTDLAESRKDNKRLLQRIEAMEAQAKLDAEIARAASQQAKLDAEKVNLLVQQLIEESAAAADERRREAAVSAAAAALAAQAQAQAQAQAAAVAEAARVAAGTGAVK